ncbi:MAG TPA: NAD-dependent epimerase [Pelobium sp.]|nr:NAD-dependent epimerase [Pelobium sp.]
MKILVTGSAGFIGFHLVKQLINRGDEVIGLDNINDYYDVQLKYDRLLATGIEKSVIAYGKEVHSFIATNYSFIKLDLTDGKSLKQLFEKHQFDAVCHLAAQAGVRYSLINPGTYIESNINGFLNVLECCRKEHVGHLIYASSSSVYGLNKTMPFSVNQKVDHPASLYAATKKSNELMAHAYSHLFDLATTGLRFFTVYGPWGRPDMALFLFTKAILEGKGIEVYNNGNMKRDFTYIDDIVNGILNVIDKPVPPKRVMDEKYFAKPPYRVFNIGRGDSVNLMDFVSEIEENLGLTATKNLLPLQDGDVAETWADITELQTELDYQPSVSIKEGVRNFVDWYKEYYTVKREHIFANA